MSTVEKKKIKGFVIEKIPAPPREEVLRAYEEHKSVRRVAEHFGVGRNTAHRWMNEHEIPRSGQGTGRKGWHHSVPCLVVRPILETIMRENPIVSNKALQGTPEHHWAGSDDPIEYLGKHSWADQMGPLIGVSSRILDRILNEDANRVAAHSVDTLLTYYGLTALWWSPALVDYYFGPNEVPPDEDTILSIQRFWGFV